MEMDFFDQAAFKIASRFNNDHTRWANKFSFLLLNTKHFLPNVNGKKILLVNIDELNALFTYQCEAPGWRGGGATHRNLIQIAFP